MTGPAGQGLRNPTQGRAYYDRKAAAGKTSNEAMRCLKRRLSDLVYKTMLNDLVTSARTGPGGHRGTSLTPARPARIPTPALGQVPSRARQSPA